MGLMDFADRYAAGDDLSSSLNRLVGRWTAESRDVDEDGRVRLGDGEWWFYCRPDGQIRAAEGEWGSRNGLEHAASLHRLDDATGLWRVDWRRLSQTPARVRARRRVDEGLEMLGEAGGPLIRASFTDLRADSFTLRGETRCAPAVGWRPVSELRLRRVL